MTISVGVVGLGEIGRGIAGNVARRGLDLAVCDVRTDAMASFSDRAYVASGARDLAERVDVVIVAVVDDAQVRSVLTARDGVFGASRGAGTVVVVSTVSADTVRQMAVAGARCGRDVVDCGVSGGPVAAAEGELVALVGGSEEAIERIRPVLETFSSIVIHMGPPGAGLQAKLARNIVQYGSWLAAFEGQRLAEAAGIELSKLALAIRESDAKIGGASRLMFRDTAEPFGPDADGRFVDAMRAGANLAHKDLEAALELASELGVTLPMTELTQTLCDSVFGLGPDSPAQSAGK